MNLKAVVRAGVVLCGCAAWVGMEARGQAGTAAATASPAATAAALPSEMPAVVKSTDDGFDFARREVMIAMRDGVKLHTVILIPKGAKGAGMLLTRTPYNANVLTNNAHSSHLASALYGYDNAVDVIVEGGYIRVVQDVRGKYGSEGEYVMNRPLHGPLNATAVDHATDTYDTIDWLVKNVPESNGKVGIIGISYDGFTPLMALVNPHPALKVSVPMNPMVDGWAMTGSTMARFGSRICRTSTSRMAAGGTRRDGGRATLTTMTCTCGRAVRASLGDDVAWSRWASGRRLRSTRATTLSGSSRRWISCWPRSR